MSIRDLKVEPVTFRRETVGFRVAGITRMCGDSLWDPICHRAIFRTEERAARFLERVKGRPSWDFKGSEWVVGHSWDSVYSVI